MHTKETNDFDVDMILNLETKDKKTRELSRGFIDTIFIISYIIMFSGIIVSIIGELCYDSNIIIIITGVAILILGAIIFSIIYKIDDEPRCFGGIDA